MEIKKSSVAQALYIKYCHQQSGYSLLDMYTQEDNHEQLALYHITESIKLNVPYTILNIVSLFKLF